MLSQEEVKKIVLPVLEKKGTRYKKTKNVFARKAKKNEQITTATSDGNETIRKAKEGDYIVRNQTEAQEEYIVSPKKFRKRYTYKKRSKGSFNEYEPKGKVIAVEVTKSVLKKFNLSSEFHFEAPWGSKMVVKENDFLVRQLDNDRVYRIARKEFFETYQRM